MKFLFTSFCCDPVYSAYTGSQTGMDDCQLDVESRDFAIGFARELLLSWEIFMNPIIKDIAELTWGPSWFDQCKACLSDKMKGKMRPEQSFDTFRIHNIFIQHFSVFVPKSLSGHDGMREKLRYVADN